MTTSSPFGVAEPQPAPSSADVVPTWRDLPQEPPYGPVLPPRTPNVGMGFAPVVVEEDASITPGQIALAAGGVLLLIAVGIGAALLLLGEDEDPVADVAPVTAPSDPSDPGGPPPLDPLPPTGQQPAPDAPQGELEEQHPPRDPVPQDSEETAPPGEDGAPEDAPPGDALPQEPAPPGGPLPLQPPPAPDPGEEGSVDLPRLFRLRTLPSGTAEDATTVRQTTREDEVVTEQVTMLTAEAGEIGVRATRAEDAVQRFEDQITDDAEELSVRGVPAYLIDGQRLVWLLPGTEETLIEIDAPPAVGTEALLTIAHGLELLR